MIKALAIIVEDRGVKVPDLSLELNALRMPVLSIRGAFSTVKNRDRRIS